VCGKVKGQANKWVQISLHPHNPYLIAIHAPSNAKLWPQVIMQDICSDTCLQKRLGQVLQMIREEPAALQPDPLKTAISVASSWLDNARLDSFDESSGIPIPQVTPDMPRAALGTEHQTAHYRITEWVPPTADSPYHKFFTAGPGADNKCYIALGASCGPHLIKSLEAAFEAGREDHIQYIRDCHAKGIPTS
jgi:hypothetical protein